MAARRTQFGQRQPFFPPGRIEGLCVDELRAVDLLPASPGPIRIDRFVERRFGQAHRYEDLAALGILGITLFRGTVVDRIIVDASLEDGSAVNDRRVRTTLAHEAGHGLLHATLFGESAAARSLFGELTDDAGIRVLCRERDVEADPSGRTYHWAEYQANRAIGGLLLPTPLVTAAIAPFLEESGSLGMRTLPPAKRAEAVRELAGTFDVNPVVVQYRLDALFPRVASGQLSL